MLSTTLKTRLTLWYCGTVLAVLCVVAAALLWQQQRLGLRRVDAELNDLQVTLANVARDEFEERAPEPEAEALSMMNTPGKALAILDENGAPLAASWKGLQLRTPVRFDDGPHVWSTPGRLSAWRVHSDPQMFGERRLVLLVGSPLADVDREQRATREAMAIVVPLALLLTAAGGFWLASTGLRPLTSMASRAAAVSVHGADDLGESHRGDELGQLARAFNGLVARLRAALETQRQFMADASHELRTPVSVLRSAAEVTLAREHRDEAEYREALTIVDGQARRITRLVDDMLVLARADAGGYPLVRELLYVDDIVAEVVSAADALARQRDVTIAVSGATDVSMQADPELLHRMLLNVVVNAVQHATSGSRVGVAIVSMPGQLVVRVSNQGTAIPDADRERIFERFVQLDPSRRSSGSGLGLPIARWIVEQHGGSVELERSGDGETVFAVTLPVGLSR